VHYPASLHSEWVRYLQIGFQEEDEPQKGDNSVAPSTNYIAGTDTTSDEVQDFHAPEGDGNNFLSQSAKVNTKTDRVGEIPITLFCMGMILRANQHKRAYLRIVNYIAFAGALLVVIQPFIINYYDTYSDDTDLSDATLERYNDPINQAMNAAFYVCATTLDMVFLPVIFAFLSAAVVAVDRKRYIAMTLNRMLNPYPRNRVSKVLYMNSELVQESLWRNEEIVGRRVKPKECRVATSTNHHGVLNDLSNVEIPVVSFDDAGNVFAYLYTRLIMQTYGLRFNFRFDVYVGTCLFVFCFPH